MVQIWNQINSITGIQFCCGKQHKVCSTNQPTSNCNNLNDNCTNGQTQCTSRTQLISCNTQMHETQDTPKETTNLKQPKRTKPKIVNSRRHNRILTTKFNGLTLAVSRNRNNNICLNNQINLNLLIIR